MIKNLVYCEIHLLGGYLILTILAVKAKSVKVYKIYIYICHFHCTAKIWFRRYKVFYRIQIWWQILNFTVIRLDNNYWKVSKFAYRTSLFGFNIYDNPVWMYSNIVDLSEVSHTSMPILCIGTSKSAQQQNRKFCRINNTKRIPKLYTVTKLTKLFGLRCFKHIILMGYMIISYLFMWKNLWLYFHFFFLNDSHHLHVYF